MIEEKKLFEEYVRSFDLNIEALMHKYTHTFRVIAYATVIARSLNLSEEEVNTCRICALFHDIGRFPQYMKYKSYYDYETCDHGDLGEEVLRKLGYKDELVLKVVKFHNKVYIPNDLTKKEELFLKITRDADKIDIMIEQAKSNTDEKYYLDEDNKQKLLNNKLLEAIDQKNNTLRILKVTALIFDINFKKSFEILKEKDIINKKMKLIIDKFPNEETFMLKDHFNKFLDDKLKN